MTRTKQSLYFELTRASRVQLALPQHQCVLRHRARVELAAKDDVTRADPRATCALPRVVRGSLVEARDEDVAAQLQARLEADAELVGVVVH